LGEKHDQDRLGPMTHPDEPRRSRGRPPADPELRREAWLKAGVQVFGERGYHATRIEDLATVAKQGKGTFYLYFDTKEALFLEMIDRFFVELTDTLKWVQGNVDASVDLDELFQAEAERVFKTLEKEREFARVLFRDGRSAGPAVEARIRKFYREMLSLSTKTFSDLKKVGLLPHIHPEVAAAMVMGGIEKTYELWITGELKGSAPTLVTEGWKFLVRGCGLTS
jgi:AcrR family transcriptional regulator